MPYTVTCTAIDHNGTRCDATTVEYMGDAFDVQYPTSKAAEAARIELANSVDECPNGGAGVEYHVEEIDGVTLDEAAVDAAVSSVMKHVKRFETSPKGLPLEDRPTLHATVPFPADMEAAVMIAAEGGDPREALKVALAVSSARTHATREHSMGAWGSLRKAYSRGAPMVRVKELPLTGDWRVVERRRRCRSQHNAFAAQQFPGVALPDDETAALINIALRRAISRLP